MSIKKIIFVGIFTLLGCFAIAQPSIVVSSYCNQANPRDEWAEFLVYQDYLDLRNYQIRDNNSAQTSWQNFVIFKNINYWKHLRKGTIIIINFRPCSFSPSIVNYTKDTSKADGYIQVNATDTALFNVSSGSLASNWGPQACGASSGNWNGPTLNFSATRDILEIQDASGNHIHALAHNPSGSPGTDYTSMTEPKLTSGASLASIGICQVCSGDTIAKYRTSTGGKATVTDTVANFSFGLPNICQGNDALNGKFWIKIREPQWISPALTVTSNAAYTSNQLDWNMCVDSSSYDLTQGYLVVRYTSTSYSTPLDGKSYATSDSVGTNGTVIYVANSSKTLTYTDVYTIPCNVNVVYRVYAFRYKADEINGNSYHYARGRAYNQTSAPYKLINRPKPTPKPTIYHY